MTDQEYIDFAYWWLVIDDTILDATNMQMLLDMVKTQYPSATECATKYYFIVAILNYLIRSSAKGQEADGGAAAGTVLKKRREKSNKREIEVEYMFDTSGATAAVESGWEKVLSDLKENPNSLGCTPFPSEGGGSSTGSVVIGGGDMYSDPYTSKRKRDEAAYNSRCTNPWRPRR